MGAGRGIAHFIPNYDVFGSQCWLGWAHGARSPAALSQGQSVPRCFRNVLVSARLFQGPSRGALAQARTFQRRAAGLGSHRSRASSISGQFRGRSRRGTREMPGKDNGLAPRVGTLGIISKEHFATPARVSNIPVWVGYPSHR